MTTLLNWLADPALQLYLLNLALAVSVAAALGCVLMVATRRASAPTRQTMLATTLVLLILSPLVAASAETLGFGLLSFDAEQPAPKQPQRDLPPTTPTPTRGTVVANGEKDSSPAAATTQDPQTEPQRAYIHDPLQPGDTSWGAASWLILAWLAGTAWLLARLAFGQLALHRLRRRLRTSDDPRLEAAAAGAARTLGLRKVPQVRCGERLPGPVSFGLLHPVLAFPTDVTKDLNDRQVEGIVLHEVAHVAQHHHVYRLAQSLARAIFWWQPLVHWVHWELCAIQEQVCDNHVVQEQGSAVDYARSLVHIAERADGPPLPSPVPSLIPFGCELETRIQKLLSQEETNMTKTSRMGLAITGLFLIGTLGAQAGLSVSPRQDKVPDRTTKSSYYPLTADASWVYRDTTDPNKAPVEVEYRCLGRVEVKGGTCHELLFRRGRYRNFEYWGIGKNGIQKYHRAYLGGLRGVSKNRKPRPILAGPIGATLTWEWTEQGSVQTMAGAPQPDPKDLRIYYKARIEEMQDKVKVPAGEFTAVRVRITSKAKYYGTSDTTWWFAKGVGLVKRLAKGRSDNPDRVMELVKFTPGVVVKETIKQSAERYLREHKALAALGKPESLGPARTSALRNRFSSQFYVARWQGRKKPVFLRIRRGKAEEFEPTKIEHWRQLIKDEHIRLENGPMGNGNASQAALHLTQAYAWFMGCLEGPKFQPYVRMSDFVTEIAYRQKTITVTGKVGSGNAKTSNVKIPVRMSFDNKTLTKMEFKNLEAAQKKVGGSIKVERFGRRR